MEHVLGILVVLRKLCLVLVKKLHPDLSDDAVHADWDQRLEGDGLRGQPVTIGGAVVTDTGGPFLKVHPEEEFGVAEG